MTGFWGRSIENPRAVGSRDWIELMIRAREDRFDLSTGDIDSEEIVRAIAVGGEQNLTTVRGPAGWSIK